MSHTNSRQPDRLKMQWDRATRLASRDWPMAARSAVMVVPKLSPSRMGMAPSRPMMLVPSTPGVAAKFCSTAIVALEPRAS